MSYYDESWTEYDGYCARNLIETHHLSKLYSRGVYALRDLSIQIEKGEFVFLTGPSGAGKSTFLRLLLRESLPSDGAITVAGRNLARLSRAGSGVSPQRRVRVPGLQAHSSEDRARERRDRAAGARRAGVDPAAQDVPGVEMGRASASDERVSAGALGRRAAADRDRARARQRPRC